MVMDTVQVENDLSADESEFLELVDRGELVRVSNVEEEVAYARRAARNTLNKTKRVNLRMTEKG